MVIHGHMSANRVYFGILVFTGTALLSCAGFGRVAPAFGGVKVWEQAEVSLKGPLSGNPFVDAELHATFEQAGKTFKVRGFYDGDGIYKLRFMPSQPGTWRWRTQSNIAALTGKQGTINVQPRDKRAHGPMRVKGTHHFAYADGTAYHPFGTTVYALAHQPLALQTQTIKSLGDSPFNKVRICVFPKWFTYNQAEPPHLPFVHKADGFPDPTRPNLEYWRLLESRIKDLQALGIEVDLILFHPYDESEAPGKPVRWGYDNMSPQGNAAYLRYAVARLAAFANIWWSMANEWDFIGNRSVEEWNQLLDVLEAEDPYGHLTSIHNGAKFFDHSRPSITHTSVQSSDADQMTQWLSKYKKPVILDECQYEGDLEEGWGNITGQELVHRHWVGFMRGGYVGHSETFYSPDDIIWWSKGGTLKGQSVARIRFLRKLVEECGVLQPLEKKDLFDPRPAARCGKSFLVYMGLSQPSFMRSRMTDALAASDPSLKDVGWRLEIIDTWGMSTKAVPGVQRGEFRIDHPAQPHLLIRATPVP